MAEITRNKEMTQKIKDAALEMGVDLVGVADPETMDGSPAGHPSPYRILPGTRSIISIAVRAPFGAIESPHPPIDGTPEEIEVIHGGVYFTSYMSMNFKLMEYTVAIANFIEKLGYKAAPIGSTLGRDEQRWLGPISLRRTAQQAGIGELGLSTLFVSPEFGPRVRLGAVLTTAPLEIDGPKLVGKVCTKCGECIKHCPTHAVQTDMDEFNRIRCIWGAMGLFKSTGWDDPPKDWMDAKSINEAMATVPQYINDNPKIAYYRGLSVKYMGYPNCLECYSKCSVGVESSKRLFGEE